MSTSYVGRFNVTLGILAGIAVAGIVIAVALLANNTSSDTGAPWSAWAPQDSGSQAAREIADHIAPLYRISGVNQLAVVTVADTADPSAVAAQASSASGTSSTSSSSGLVVAVRPNANSSAISLLPGKTIAYNLCGLGSTNCSIGIGTPSADRELLLRREALELALYTFKYVSGVQNVVAILPPGHPATASTGTLSAKPPSSSSQSSTSQTVDEAVVFQRTELQPFLSHPVTTLLSEEFPPSVAQVPLWKQTTEASYVEQITARGLFTEHLTTAQDGTNLIVLDPQPPS
jgi:hypothetical protein